VAHRSPPRSRSSAARWRRPDAAAYTGRVTTNPAAASASARYELDLAPNVPERAPRPPAAPPWSAAKRVAFRFVCLYLLLYNLPFPLSFPPASAIHGARAWAPLVRWTGAHVLRLAEPITVLPNGSGDTTFNYVQILCMLAVSVVGAAVWSALDRRRARYDGAYDLLRTYVRYALGFALCAYGAIKVIKLQFPDLGASQLATSFGDASPMGLLWRFMGFSYAYNVYAGLAEMVPGALLFFRRTTTLGALLAAAAMSNVVMLNFAYDVPVKLYSSHLFLMALFLLAPALPRLVRGVALGRAVGPEPVAPFLPSMPANWRPRVRVVKALVVAFPTVGMLTLSWMRRARQTGGDARTFAAYTVERYERLATAPPRDSSAHWTRVELRGAVRARVETAAGAPATYALSDDPMRRVYLLMRTEGTRPDTAALLHYTPVDSSSVELAGRVGADSVRMRWRRAVAADSIPPLLRRGFHWVNEQPYGR